MVPKADLPPNCLPRWSLGVRGAPGRRRSALPPVAAIGSGLPDGGSRPRPFSNRGGLVKALARSWSSLPGSWFSPGSVARPMMGVRDVTPPGVKRSDLAYAQVDPQPLRGRPHPPSRQGPEPPRERSWCGGTRQAAFSRVHQNSVPSVQMQCRMMAILRASATRAFLPPIRFAKRVPQAFNGENR